MISPTTLHNIRLICSGSPEMFKLDLPRCVKDIFDSLYATAVYSPDMQDRMYAVCALRSFAFKHAAKLDSAFFDRSICTKPIQNMLSPKLHQLRLEKQHGKDSAERRLEAKKAKAELAFQLGINPILNDKGLSGSEILVDLKGKKLAVFKSLRIAPTKTIKKIINFVRCHLRTCFKVYPQEHFVRNKGKLPSLYSDVASRVASDFFGINIVPNTTRARFKRLDGSSIDGMFMVWEDNFKPSGAISAHIDPTQEELTLFQKMAILDYFLGNLDRHSDNWLVRQDKKGHLREIVLIDNSNAFIDKSIKGRLSHIFARWFQYAWRTHPYAKYPFTQEALKTISLFTQQNTELFLKVLQKELLALGMPLKGIKQFMKHKMQRLLMQRVKVIQSMSSVSTPKQLASLSTQEAISKYLNKRDLN